MTSLWTATARGRHWPALDRDIEVDVAVLGGGIAGLTTALMCQLDGLRVAVIEAQSVAAGVTANTTGKLTALQEQVYAKLEKHYGAEAATGYGQASAAAVQTVAGLVDHLGIECSFERRPAFLYTTDPDVDLRPEAEAMRRTGLDVAETTDTGLPFEVASALRLDDQAQFHARRYCVCLADEIARLGGLIFESTPATDVDDGDPCIVTTRRAKVRARDVVVATHAPFLHRGLYFAKTRPSRSYAVAGRVTSSPGGMYLSADEPVRSVRDHIEDDQMWLIVGGESHKTGQDDGTGRHYAALRSFALRHFGMDAFPYQWSAQDYLPADELPYIGTLAPSQQHVWVATGFRKWGMTNSVIAAEILSARIAGRQHPHQQVFDTRRHPLATIRRMTAEGIDTAKRFLGDRFAAPTNDEPGPGQGGVVVRDGRAVAVFVDEDGSRHEVSATCTHMGCLVAFNDAERSWDCPCHGSRFGLDGSVLDGPAVEPLKQLERTERD